MRSMDKRKLYDWWIIVQTLKSHRLLGKIRNQDREERTPLRVLLGHLSEKKSGRQIFEIIHHNDGVFGFDGA